MELSVQKWGNSAAVRLPTELLALLKVKLGDKLSVNVQPDGVLLKPARPSYSLDDLLSQCDPAAPEPADLADWNNMKPVGRETW
ncbi:AbrB/MazE/SpoVT family DNA-binding domain-containing protein [Duganella sp. FT80W]|uniref:AbrB/MazE/SpoVT family DNA-binding domain-containing protein n=1 Tax=Duganella guangzhouensis TaxID=2666084 RepID=A0A6I2L2L9_9BURK|nr:AbrB/MazE/SpoVT family DNA-binding domain-containing protein [Duganella guangzhouensis]MRW90549.1 AbrB/MazE/SpoVT family DNA-binding domain-containing protein [Duganella guangzhouensis]